jgi:hypothetical protein
MADCNTYIQKITFDVSDPQITQVRVEIDFDGDCGILVKRVYEKSFPARYPAVEIMTMEGGVKDYLLW